jgi:hypothetical protein
VFELAECVGCLCELVWDAKLIGTAITPAGEALQVGEGTEWTPARMVSAAVQSSLMVEFLRRAEKSGIAVNGYVSSAEARLPCEPGNGARVLLAPCIVIAEADAAGRAEGLFEEALAASPICRLLGSAVQVKARFVVAMEAPA